MVHGSILKSGWPNLLAAPLSLTKEWREDSYPPWAHGPGYVVSHDIASAVHKKYQDGQLKVQITFTYINDETCVLLSFMAIVLLSCELLHMLCNESSMLL